MSTAHSHELAAEDRYRALLAVSEAIVSCRDLPALFHAFAEQLVQVAHYDALRAAAPHRRGPGSPMRRRSGRGAGYPPASCPPASVTVSEIAESGSSRSSTPSVKSATTVARPFAPIRCGGSTSLTFPCSSEAVSAKA